MIQQKPLPAIALSAFTLAKADFERVLNQLAAQTAAAMGLDDDWQVDFVNGLAFRDTAEAPQEQK